MWHLETDKTGLLTVVSGSKGQLATNLTSIDRFPSQSPASQRLHLLWTDDPHSAMSLPTLFITAPGETRDFLAWTSTYLDGYRPLTALCRVVDWSVFARARAASEQSRFRLVESACAALILAEALTHGRGRLDVSSLNIPACESTFSFCIARLLYLGIEDMDSLVAKRWRLAREVAKQPQRTPSTEEIEPMWSLLRVLVDMGRSDANRPQRIPYILGDMCGELSTTGRISPRLLRHVVGDYADLGTTLAAMDRTREERVTAFEAVLRSIQRRELSKKLDVNFVAGYMASLLNPGSLEYVSLVTSYLTEHPTLLLWYALCEGLHPQSKVLGQFGGFGRRLLRDVRAPDSLMSRPMGDISVDELEVLSASRAGLEYLRIGTQSFARVELCPMVYTTLRVVGAPQSGDQMSLFGGQSAADINDWMEAMRRALDSVNKIFGSFGSGESLRPKGKRGRRE